DPGAYALLRPSPVRLRDARPGDRLPAPGAGRASRGHPRGRARRGPRTLVPRGVPRRAPRADAERPGRETPCVAMLYVVGVPRPGGVPAATHGRSGPRAGPLPSRERYRVRV